MTYKYYISADNNVHKNIALEKVLFDTIAEDEVIMMLWVNSSCIVIGKNQNIYSEVNLEAAQDDGVLLSRRFSGGGAVYHDCENLNFTFIAHNKNYNAEEQTAIIINALSSLGVSAETNGRNDIIESGGRKISGNAYLNNATTKLRHGTLMCGVNIDKLTKYLTVSAEKLAAKGVKSVKSRVCNLHELVDDISVKKIEKAIMQSAEKTFGTTMKKIILTNEQADMRDEYYDLLSSHAWVFNKKDKVINKITRRFDWGCVELGLLSQGENLAFTLYSDGLDTDHIVMLKKRFACVTKDELKNLALGEDDIGEVARLALEML